MSLDLQASLVCNRILRLMKARDSQKCLTVVLVVEVFGMVKGLPSNDDQWLLFLKGLGSFTLMIIKSKMRKSLKWELGNNNICWGDFNVSLYVRQVGKFKIVSLPMT